VGTLCRETLGELAIRYDRIYKIARGEGETYIYYIAIQMGVFMIALEKLICFCPMRPIFIAKLRLPIAYLYYLMIPTVKTTNNIQFDLCMTKSLNYPHYDGHFSNYDIKFCHCGYGPLCWYTSGLI